MRFIGARRAQDYLAAICHLQAFFRETLQRMRFYRNRGREDLETKRRAVASITRARRVTLWHRLQDKVHKLQARIRGRNVRDHLDRMWVSAIRLQTCWRMRQERT